MESCEFKTIKLEAPKTSGGMPLFEALSKRQSNRDFDNTKFLSLSQLSQLLWCCYGTNTENKHKVVPSALNMHPLTVFVFMKCGTFKYCPDSSELQPVKEGDNRSLCGFQPFVKNAALNIMFVTDLTKPNPTPIKGFELTEEIRVHSSLLDVAHCCQNVYLYCASEGLKCVERGSFDHSKILDCLGLDKKYKSIVSLSVGY